MDIPLPSFDFEGLLAQLLPTLILLILFAAVVKGVISGVISGVIAGMMQAVAKPLGWVVLGVGALLFLQVITVQDVWAAMPDVDVDVAEAFTGLLEFLFRAVREAYESSVAAGAA